MLQQTVRQNTTEIHKVHENVIPHVTIKEFIIIINCNLGVRQHQSKTKNRIHYQRTIYKLLKIINNRITNVIEKMLSYLN